MRRHSNRPTSSFPRLVGSSTIRVLLFLGGTAQAAPAIPEAEHERSRTGGAPSIDPTWVRKSHSDEPDTEPPRSSWLSDAGLRFDLGSVEGGTLSAVYRASPLVRLSLGGGSNSASLGYRAGLELQPWGPNWALALEGGHFFPGDVRGLLQPVSSASLARAHALERFAYDFVNLQGGWEFERGGLSFLVRGGFSLLHGELGELAAGQHVDIPFNVGTSPQLWLVLPSVKLGFVGLL